MGYDHRMNRRKVSEETDLTIRVPMTSEQRQTFDQAMKTGMFVKGRWVREAIFEKLARISRDQLQVVDPQ